MKSKITPFIAALFALLASFDAQAATVHIVGEQYGTTTASFWVSGVVSSSSTIGGLSLGYYQHRVYAIRSDHK